MAFSSISIPNLIYRITSDTTISGKLKWEKRVIWYASFRTQLCTLLIRIVNWNNTQNRIFWAENFTKKTWASDVPFWFVFSSDEINSNEKKENEMVTNQRNIIGSNDESLRYIQNCNFTHEKDISPLNVAFELYSMNVNDRFIQLNC